MRISFGKGDDKQARSRRDSLRVRGLLAPWFMEYRLDEEIERARRYARPLTVLVVAPVLLPGEHLSGQALDSAAEAMIEASRATDLVGWADNTGRILLVMPETPTDVADVVAQRVKAELWHRSRHFGGQKWDVDLLDIDALLEPLIAA